MATSLRNFQTEIDEIHSREVSKQRAAVAAADAASAKKPVKPKDVKEAPQKEEVTQDKPEAPRIQELASDLQV